MTVTYDVPVRIGPNTWRISWTSDEESPIFRIFVDGRLAAETVALVWALHVRPGAFPIIEVLDDPDAEPLTAHPPHITLHWRTVGGTDYYRIDEYVGSEWVERTRVDEDGSGWYEWCSGVLEDDTTHQFRAVAVGMDGNESTATQRTVLMVRHPDPPDVAYAYDDQTQKVTIT